MDGCLSFFYFPSVTLDILISFSILHMSHSLLLFLPVHVTCVCHPPKKRENELEEKD